MNGRPRRSKPCGPETEPTPDSGRGVARKRPLRCSPMVVAQHSAEPTGALDCPGGWSCSNFTLGQPIVDPLVIPLPVLMRGVLTSRVPQRPLIVSPILSLTGTTGRDVQDDSSVQILDRGQIASKCTLCGPNLIGRRNAGCSRLCVFLLGLRSIRLRNVWHLVCKSPPDTNSVTRCRHTSPRATARWRA